MRPAIARIDLDALRHNYRLAKRLGGGRALAVVKADAYGHGAVRCAKALKGEADGFAVACIEEALELRESGIRDKPVLLLEGFFEESELPLIAQHDLWSVVAMPWQVEAIERFASPRPLRLWLKLDSGMHRLGLSPTQFREAHARLKALAQVESLTLMTHFARADEPDSARTGEQARIFADAIAGFDEETSLSNSPALLAWPQVRGDWARPGLMLYGANPLPAAAPLPGAVSSCGTAIEGALRPVMRVESKIIAVRDLAAGEPVGYGARFVAERPTRVGVVAFGYADGYPQMAPNGAPVSIDGQPGRLIGRVSMDMLTVDLTDHPRSGIGSTVQLWGDAPTVSALAAACKLSPYEMLCALKRAKRVYWE
ncbi:MAG: alanine racemase [Pseudoxanthomonas sp.]